jgi:hypothetical protein
MTGRKAAWLADLATLRATAIEGNDRIMANRRIIV